MSEANGDVGAFATEGMAQETVVTSFKRTNKT